MLARFVFRVPACARASHGEYERAITYTPDVGFTGTDSFDVAVIDNDSLPLAAP
jgi:hypothetical protein